MKILFQGDSVTDCGRGNSGGCGYEQGAMGPGYPGLVKSRLSCDRPGAGFEFVNLGISGNRIVDLYARWRSDCINLAPDVVSILIGVNDSWHEQHGNGVEVLLNPIRRREGCAPRTPCQGFHAHRELVDAGEGAKTVLW